MTRVFVPSLGPLAAELVGVTLPDLWKDSAQLARAALEAASRTSATHVLFPFDRGVLAQATVELLDRAEGGVEGSEFLLLDPEEVLEHGRAPIALEAARYIASASQLAASVVTPVGLARQLAGDPDDEDQVMVCADVVAAFLRRLLEAGASLVLVAADNASERSGASTLESIAEHFGVRLVFVGDESEVIELRAEALEQDLGALDAQLPGVVTTEPLPPEIDLARVAGVARRLVA